MYPKYLGLVYKLSPFFNPLTAEAAWNTLTDPIRVAFGDVTVPTGPIYRYLYSNPQTSLYVLITIPLFCYLYELTFSNVEIVEETQELGFYELIDITEDPSVFNTENLTLL